MMASNVKSYPIHSIVKAPRPQDKVFANEESYLGLRDCACQTVFREAEAQTVPWTPPYRVLQCKTPEVLTLACLSFDNGLLVTKHDIEILHRLRKKREWEKYLTRNYATVNLEFRLKIISEIEKHEWVAREKEIDEINKLRMKLARKQVLEQRKIVQERMNERIQRVRERNDKEKRIKLPKINAECSRALRKTYIKPLAYNRLKRLNIIEKFHYMSSDLNAPLAMYGNNPAYAHEKLCVEPRPKIIGDIYNALWKGISTPLPQVKERHVKKHCCKRIQFYCMPKEIPVGQINNFRRLHKNIEKVMTGPLPCALGEQDEEEEETLKNVIILQSIIKGRAIQSMVLRHMKSHRDLVQELKSTVGLNPKDKQQKYERRKNILKGIRNFNIALQKKGQMIGLIEKLEGHAICAMLDYTSAAQIRLEDARRTHLFALAAEKERWARESAEAGRRQQEEIRQRQHEEIYKQTLKIHEITSDVLLEQTIEEQLKDTSKAMAVQWAKKHAKEMDKIVDLSQLEEFEKMEHITKLTNQFLLDQLEKNQIRDELKAKTAMLRKYAETVIYEKENEFVEVDSSSEYTSNTIMRKLCPVEKEGKEWEDFYDEVLDTTHEVRQLLTDNLDYIPLYEDPSLVKTLFGNEEEPMKIELSEVDRSEVEPPTVEPTKVEMSSKKSLGSEPLDVESPEEKPEEESLEEKPLEEESEEKPLEVEPSKGDTEYQQKVLFERESVESKENKKKPDVEKVYSSDYSDEESEEMEYSSFSSSEKDDFEQSREKRNIDMDIVKDDVEYINKFIKYPVSSEEILSSDESSESPKKKKISSKELKMAEKRRKIYEEEEKKRFLFNMAQKLMEQIMARANVIAKKVQEMTQVTGVDMTSNEACAETLLQAYRIVSKALLNFTNEISEFELKEQLVPWLDTILKEAEKRVFGLFDVIQKENESTKDLTIGEEEEEEEVKTKEDKVDVQYNTKNIVEATTALSMDRLPLIPEANAEDYTFYGEPRYCTEVKYKEDNLPYISRKERIAAKCLLDEEDMKRLVYTGVLIENKLFNIPEEKQIKKPRPVIKSRRSGIFDYKSE